MPASAANRICLTQTRERRLEQARETLKARVAEQIAARQAETTRKRARRIALQIRRAMAEA